MSPTDLAIPILPSRSIQATVGFYQALGFEGGAHGFDSGYAILRRGTLELHFFAHPALVPSESWAGCYLRVQDVDGVYRAFSACPLPRSGIPRMDALLLKRIMAAAAAGTSPPPLGGSAVCRAPASKGNASGAIVRCSECADAELPPTPRSSGVVGRG